MKIVEQTESRLVLEDEAQRVGATGRAVAAALSLAVLVYLGVQPHFDPWTLLFPFPLALYWLGIAFLKSHHRITLDKATARFTLDRINPWRSRTIRDLPLSEIQQAVVGELGDVRRLEFSLVSGETLAPRRSYNNYYDPASLQKVAERVNGFISPPAGARR